MTTQAFLLQRYLERAIVSAGLRVRLRRDLDDRRCRCLYPLRVANSWQRVTRPATRRRAAIAEAVRTTSTLSMVEEAERQVAELEASLETPAPMSKVTFLPSVVESYLKDLKGTLGKDTHKARGLLAKMVGHVTLRRDGDHLVAEL